jgi:hypothetical protein
VSWTPVDDGRLLFNHGEFDRIATDLLGLRWPVSVKWVAGLDVLGRYRNLGGAHGGAHTIQVRSGMDADETASVLFHELGHCHQAEGSGIHKLRTLMGDDWLEEDADWLTERLRSLRIVRPAAVYHRTRGTTGA